MNNNRLYILPLEIITKIISYVNDIKYLIFLYESSNFFKKLINNEILIFLQLKRNVIKEKHFLNNSLTQIINTLDLYILENNFMYKYEKKDFEEIWYEHNIFRKIIKFKLKCNTCKYIYNNNNHKNIYECINCEKIICEQCCISCCSCFPHHNMNDECIHCFECENKCFKNIAKKIEKLNIREIDYLKKTIFKTYIKFIGIQNINSFVPNYIYDYIEYTNFDDKIKLFLKTYSSELENYIINNKSINVNIRIKSIVNENVNNNSLIKQKDLSKYFEYLE